MTTTKIAIVGGGPAGSSVALNLLREGVDPGDLLILDRAEFPRPKLCGGALTFRGTQTLQRLVGKPTACCETQALEFRSRFGRFTVREAGPQWIYDRTWLDDYLLTHCMAQGISVRTGTTVRSMRPTSEGWKLETSHGSESVSWVIGADGAMGMTRRASRFPGGKQRHEGRLVEAVFECNGVSLATDCSLDEKTLYFDFDPILDGIPGYAWMFPYPKSGSTRIWKLGLMDGKGCIAAHELRRWLKGFAARNGFRMVDAKISGWPEHYFHRGARAHRPGLILTGEAYGIDPLLGEGLAPSFAMAEYAAHRLRNALDAGSSRIASYEPGFCNTQEGLNLLFQGAVANRLYGPHPEPWMRTMFNVPFLHRLASPTSKPATLLRNSITKTGTVLRCYVKPKDM